MKRYWDHYFSFSTAKTRFEAFFRGCLIGIIIGWIFIFISNLGGI